MSGVAGQNGSDRPQQLVLALRHFRVDQVDDPVVLEGLQEAALDLLSRIVVQERFLRRMTPPPEPTGPVEWLDAKQVAALLHRSESTVRHMPPDKIPGRRQQAKGFRVQWNKQVLLNYLAECSSR